MTNSDDSSRPPYAIGYRLPAEVREELDQLALQRLYRAVQDAQEPPESDDE